MITKTIHEERHLCCRACRSRRTTSRLGRMSQGVRQHKLYVIVRRRRNPRTCTNFIYRMIYEDDRKTTSHSQWAYHGWFILGVMAMLAISPDRGPSVRRRSRHSTGSRNLNIRSGVGTDIRACTSSGTQNSAVRTVILLNRDWCVCWDTAINENIHEINND